MMTELKVASAIAQANAKEKAAAQMLAALKHIPTRYDLHPSDVEIMDAAIAAAQAAGITPDDGSKPFTMATPEQIEAARELYQTDDTEIDDFNVATSEGDGGTWIAAWVWLADATEDEEEA